MANSEGERGSAGLAGHARSRLRSVVSGLVEEWESSHATVQDVLGEVSSSEAWSAWHVFC